MAQHLARTRHRCPPTPPPDGEVQYLPQIHMSVEAASGTTSSSETYRTPPAPHDSIATESDSGKNDLNYHWSIHGTCSSIARPTGTVLGWNSERLRDRMREDDERLVTSGCGTGPAECGCDGPDRRPRLVPAVSPVQSNPFWGKMPIRSLGKSSGVCLRMLTRTSMACVVSAFTNQPYMETPTKCGKRFTSASSCGGRPGVRIITGTRSKTSCSTKWFTSLCLPTMASTRPRNTDHFLLQSATGSARNRAGIATPNSRMKMIGGVGKSMKGTVGPRAPSWCPYEAINIDEQLRRCHACSTVSSTVVEHRPPLSVEEAADYLNVSVRFMKDRRRDGRIRRWSLEACFGSTPKISIVTSSPVERFQRRPFR